MKDQVPVVLLNKWLDVEQEKSGFAQAGNCQLDDDEYSVYSETTVGNALSIKGSALRKPVQPGQPGQLKPPVNLGKRNSVLHNPLMRKNTVMNKLKANDARRMTIKGALNLNTDIVPVNDIINEVDDLTSNTSNEFDVSKSRFTASRDVSPREGNALKVRILG